MKAQGKNILRCVTVPLFCILVLCQCETTRTVKSVRTSISIDSEKWGGQGGGGEEELPDDKKYSIADRGWDIAPDGTRTAKRNNLYADQKARGFDGKVGMKEARFAKTDAKVKEFKTPEYLKMQEFNGVSEAKLGNTTAREGNAEKNESSFASKLFGTKSKSSETYTTYKAKDFADSNKAFKTDGNRAGMNAVNNAPRADGVQQMMGYQQNASMSMDDVKKLLNPNAYARGTGITAR